MEWGTWPRTARKWVRFVEKVFGDDVGWGLERLRMLALVPEAAICVSLVDIGRSFTDVCEAAFCVGLVLFL